MKISLRNRRNKNITKILPFKITALIVLIVVLAMGSALARELYREYKIKKEIDSLKAEIESVRKDNYELSQFLDYYQTDQYKEAEARRRLNLKAEGEKVVMIDNAQGNYEGAQKTVQQTENIPNYKKWWNYFFASR